MKLLWLFQLLTVLQMEPFLCIYTKKKKKKGSNRASQYYYLKEDKEFAGCLAGSAMPSKSRLMIRLTSAPVNDGPREISLL